MFTNLNINTRYAEALAGATNLAISENSKAQYKTAVKHIERISQTLQIDMSLPFDITKTLNYVAYLLEDRGVSSKTVSQYLSAVRMYHLCQGMDPTSLRPPIISLILKGREHWENVQKTLQQKPQRVAVTLKVLKFLKRKILETS